MGDLVAQLRCLGFRGILLLAAEQGQIKALSCEMPDCYCPDELGGRSFFEPVTRELPDWMPSHDHYPMLKSQGGKRTLENSRLSHRLCNRVDYSKSIGRKINKDLGRVDAAREPRNAKRLVDRRDVALMLCGDDNATLRDFVQELEGWHGVDVEPYFDRGNGPTGFKILREQRRFANVFPSKSLQFAHGGAPLTDLGLPSESDVGRDYQSIPADELGRRLSEARLLASYAYWKASH
jgi:hypothetical protein